MCRFFHSREARLAVFGRHRLGALEWLSGNQPVLSAKRSPLYRGSSYEVEAVRFSVLPVPLLRALRSRTPPNCSPASSLNAAPASNSASPGEPPRRRNRQPAPE
jgi:hypothetical protein